MKTHEWFQKTLESLKDTPEFRLETLILELTEEVCKRMKQKKMTRTKLAEELGVSPPAVTKVLNGSSNFTLKTLLSLADALNLDLAVSFTVKERDILTRPQFVDTKVFFEPVSAFDVPACSFVIGTRATASDISFVPIREKTVPEKVSAA